MLCFVSLLASHKVEKPEFGLSKPLLDFDYKTLAIALEEGGEFDKDNPGRHICIWDFDSIQEEGRAAGFSAIEKKPLQRLISTGLTRPRYGQNSPRDEPLC